MKNNTLKITDPFEQKHIRKFLKKLSHHSFDSGQFFPEDGYYGEFGGRYSPESLIPAIEELEHSYKKALQSKSFLKEWSHYQVEFANRPSKLTFAEQLSKEWNAEIWLKREDLNHTGSHKINNALGQALLARRMKKKRLIAETGAGQHGVATATVAARFGFECTIYMGGEDVRRQKLNVYRMQLLGATVVPVNSGSGTLKDATNEAMRDWSKSVGETHYVIGSAIGPHPFPTMVRDFQSVIGKEARRQIKKQAGALPDSVIACVGGGSNAIGIFHGFLFDRNVRLIGAEAGGRGDLPGDHAATLCFGRPGYFHGTHSLFLQKKDGQIQDVHSISAGLDYPGVGPEHAYLSKIGRAHYYRVTDEQSLQAFVEVSKLEGLVPALETAHAFATAKIIAKKNPKSRLLICVSGRGDKDGAEVARLLNIAES
ncbi:MAG: tryptophan synthase subunit beta [Leptonema sp. (in: Bacteria)]|nr:tryptophan synthase subunit beta [Leptonema sp. (in: bacteria)]